MTKDHKLGNNIQILANNWYDEGMKLILSVYQVYSQGFRVHHYTRRSTTLVRKEIYILHTKYFCKNIFFLQFPGQTQRHNQTDKGKQKVLPNQG